MRAIYWWVLFTGAIILTILVLRLQSFGVGRSFARYFIRAVISRVRFILILLLFAAGWATFFTVVLCYVAPIGCASAFKWVVVEMFGSQIPGLPEVRGVVAHTVLTLSGVFGPIFVALLVGFLADIFIRMGEGYVKGLTTDARQEGYRDHLVVVGWNEASMRAVQEILEASVEERYRDKVNGIVIVVPPSYDASLVRAELESLVEGVKASLPREKAARLGARWLVVKGPVASPYTLERANLQEARGVIVTMGSDEKTLDALLAVMEYLQVARQRGSWRAGEKIIAVEVLEDENEDLFTAVKDRLTASASRAGSPGIRLFIILSRSYAGKLLASALTEPLSVMVTMELITFRQGMLDLVHGRWSQLAVQGEMVERLEPILARRNGRWEIVSSAQQIDGDSEVIAVRRFRVELGERVRNFRDEKSIARFNMLRSPTVPGHYAIIGFTEATESLVKELKRKRAGARAQLLVEEFHAINRSIIIVSAREVFEELLAGEASALDTIVHVRGDPTRPETLRRAGLLSSAAIIVSMDSDARALKVALQTRHLVDTALRGELERLGGGVELRSPLLLVEAKDKETRDRLLAIGAADFAVASRHLAGQLMAYVILDSIVFEAVRDIISSTEGQLDVRQISLSMLPLQATATIAEVQEAVARHLGAPAKVLALARLDPAGRMSVELLPPPDARVEAGEGVEVVVLTLSTVQARRASGRGVTLPVGAQAV